METKKSKTANLENKKNLYFQLGLMITLALILVAFEWKSADIENENFAQGISITDYVEDYIPPTRPEKPQKPIQPNFELIIKSNEAEFVEIEIEGLEIKPGEGVEPWRPIDTPEPTDSFPICFNPQEGATFNGGGIEKFQEYILNHVNYTEKAKSLGLQGRVTAQFIVNKKGRIERIEILRGVDPLLDNEVIEVLANSPKWKPAKQYGIPVNVSFAIPVKFELTEL